jgi:5-formyltetrahydrofolate cyclo-ligase
VLEKRNALAASDVERHSRFIQEHVIRSKEFQSAMVVATYFAFGSEVRTNLIIEQARKLGKVVALPSVEGNRIAFYEMLSGKYLVTGRFGMMEPLPYGPVDAINLLVVPGIAFDRKGYRLGYGKGYYDRFLSGKRGIFSIGLAYKFQLLESLPHGKHDKKLDAVATEEGVLCF